MRRSSYPPRHLFVDATPVVNDLPARLARLKQVIDLPWDGLAACLGVDPRQLKRWRKGTNAERLRDGRAVPAGRPHPGWH